ncbi:protein adenylyltransferase SelO family protein, partial [Alphaproteobacteria bacterium]|nr:protein adenylyltransferase SelO family protein [Alphaproteobacteria bacterium]
MIKKMKIDPGWNFNNSYLKLPETLYHETKPIPVNNPELILFNNDLSNLLSLDFSKVSNEEKAHVFSGNIIPNGSNPISQAYAGHQFGHFTILGDGRAILLGEHLNKSKDRFDIQLKGSGKTPYSRNGDGRSAISPVLREYIISESMYSLGIPTTRSLSVVKTGEKVIREKILDGGVLTRVASSHIRIGTFQYLSSIGDLKSLKKLLNYTVKRHYKNILENNENLSINLIKNFLKKQVDLTINWMRVGFVHGVLNTDNVLLSGETIDYGPCAFMDYYKPNAHFSSIDVNGRYS